MRGKPSLCNPPFFDPARALLTAAILREGRVYALDGNQYFARPAPSLAVGAGLLARCAADQHPEPGPPLQPASVDAMLDGLGFLPGWSGSIARVDFVSTPQRMNGTEYAHDIEESPIECLHRCVFGERPACLQPAAPPLSRIPPSVRMYARSCVSVR